MNKIIHHILLSHTSDNLSGGERALIDMVQDFSINSVEQIIYTSETGKNLYSKFFDSKLNIKYVVIGEKKIEKINEYFAYFYRVIECLFKLKKFNANQSNIMISHDGFLPTVIYSFLLYKTNKNVKWYGIFHMKSPSLFKGFAGEYTNRFFIPNISLVRYYIEEKIFFLLTKNNLTQIITVNPIYKTFLSKIYKKVYVLEKFGSLKKIELDDNISKDFDLVFMARFHLQKGVFELIDILAKLKKEKKDITLAIIGGGNDKMEKTFFKKVAEEGLESNIKYFGYISDNKKFKILQRAKLFLFPSYYESYGLVILEAMQIGLPVISYKLPPYVVFKKGIVKVSTLDNNLMAKKILEILRNDSYYLQLRKEALNFTKDFIDNKEYAQLYKELVVQ